MSFHSLIKKHSILLTLIIAYDPKSDPAKVNELLFAAAPKQKWAASELASRLAEGVGGIRDLKRADQLYEKLADENLRVAHLWLAKAREEGLVGGKNLKEALSHYLAAAALEGESWLQRAHRRLLREGAWNASRHGSCSAVVHSCRRRRQRRCCRMACRCLSEWARPPGRCGQGH